jgi:hypothetical protein
VVGGDPCLFTRVVSPDHVCRNRKALEILNVQLPLATSRRQLGERVTPDPTLERAASSLCSIGHGHPLQDMPGSGCRRPPVPQPTLSMISISSSVR